MRLVLGVSFYWVSFYWVSFLFVYVGVGFAFWVCCLLMLICTKVTKACGFLAVSFYTGLKGHQGSLLSKTSESK